MRSQSKVLSLSAFSYATLILFSYRSSRQVDPSEGEKLAKENKCAWVETSAKDGTNVSKYRLTSLLRSVGAEYPLPTGKVFELCLQEIEKRTAPSQAEPQAKSCVVM